MLRVGENMLRWARISSVEEVGWVLGSLMKKRVRSEGGAGFEVVVDEGEVGEVLLVDEEVLLEVVEEGSGGRAMNVRSGMK